MRVTNKTVKVLLIEDDAEDAAAIRRSLRKGRSRSVRVSDVSSLDDALHHLHTEAVDLVLLDVGLKGTTGVESVRQIRRTAPTVPIVVVADESHERLAIHALQRDAQDYLLKHQLNPTSVARAVRYALEPDRWQDQYRRQLSISPDGVLIVDSAARILFVNVAAAGMLGGAPARLSDLPESMRSWSPPAVDVTLETGTVVEVREVATAWSGRPARLITMRDITERRAVERQLGAMAEELKRANERLELLAGTDPLTRVLNRRGIEEALGGELRRMERSGDPLMGVLIDCDDFKQVNDSFGHSVGDAVLAALSRSVMETVRAGDHVGRVGGDEFLVLLPGTTVAQGMVVAEKVRQAIKATPLPLATQGLTLSASLGIGRIPSDFVSLEEVLASLHSALRRGKEKGKDIVADAGPGHGGERASGRTRHELDPAVIPLHVLVLGIRHLDDGRLIGHEALIRGPPGYFAMPSDLFRAAFERNVLTTLDLRALRTSLARFRETTWGGWYHLNVFPSTLLDTPTERILPMLAVNGAREGICLELSEQQFLGDPTALRGRIGELREAGCRIAIDDVGFGRTSIEALLLLEPDIVKVDRRCIRSISTDVGERRRLERLLAMLRAVGTVVIVEGIESAEQLRALREMGVRYGQGYLWGRPSLEPDEDALATMRPVLSRSDHRNAGTPG